MRIARLTCAAACLSLAGTAPRAGVRVDDAAVRAAMREELARSTAELRLGDEPRPYYIAYTISDAEQATVSATFGAVTAAHAYRGRLLRTDMRVGSPAFDNTNFEPGAKVDALPEEDDYAALRRELWLRSDEAYKAALELLARKRAAAAGQSGGEEDPAVGDFSSEPPGKLEMPFPAGEVEPEALRAAVVKLSAVFRDYPAITNARVTGTYAVVRRRMASSEGAWVDDAQRTVRLDVVAETQADDGMKLRDFVPFNALEPTGLPPVAEMEKAARAMATELVAMRTAPVAESGAGAVLFEGLASAQLTKLLLADHLAGTPPSKTATAASDDGGQQSALATKLKQKVAAPLLSAVDDPLLAKGPGKVPLFGAYRVDDEGVPAQRVSVVEHGVLAGLLMTRTPRQEIVHSNGHARAPRFAGPHAHVGTLVLSAKTGLPRKGLLGELARIAKGGGVTTYVVRLLDDGLLPAGDSDDLLSMFSFGAGGGHGPPPVRPLVVYRVDKGKETLVRGLALEDLQPRSLKDVTAAGRDAFVYNYIDEGNGFAGVPTTIIAPSFVISDVDIRRLTGKNRKPPLYPPPGLAVAP
ncbi:MAG TPA: metallopeptidase TldD-related protein [Polyangia bacterium]|jgi:TldD protein|nr:metallopeptidase TldD-related protein [Polyangia bacterium]